MTSAISVQDGIALLERSSLPTVVTEGSTDYRVMRRMEERLSDLGLDFLPLGGRNTVLGVWDGLSEERKRSLVVIVDLDTWVYFGIPNNYHHQSVIFTQGYSIENDLFLDADLLRYCDANERSRFFQNLDVVCAHHARELVKCRNNQPHELKTKAHSIIMQQNLTPALSHDELVLKQVLVRYYGQILRGKTLLQLISIELTRSGRVVKFGYDHIYEICSANSGPIFKNLEQNIRFYFQ